MAGKQTASAAFMRATGRLRTVFGPAQVTSLDHPMTEENKQLLETMQGSSEQWQTKKRADGSTYIVAKSRN